MTYRVIQWGPGFIGTPGMKYVIKHPLMELVGVRCFSPSKVGVDAGTLCGLDPIGVKATDDEAALLATAADCVVFTCNDTTMQDPLPGTPGYEFVRTICRILESGKNVVATSPIQMLLPKTMGSGGDELVRMLDTAGIRGNASVHFVGLEPGFMGDTLASMLSSMSMDITSIRAYELVDWANYDNYDTLRALGLGCRPDDPSRPYVLGLFKATWSCTIREIADTLNINLDEIRIWDRPWLAEEAFVTPGGYAIEAGTVAVGRWALEGIVDGVPRVAIEHCNRMRSDLAPELPSISPGGGYRIEIESNELPISANIFLGRGAPGGKTYNSFDTAMFATVARAVNAIELVCEAAPGFRTKEDLPPITGRNAMWL